MPFREVTRDSDPMKALQGNRTHRDVVVHTDWAKAFCALLYMMPLLQVSLITFCDKICRGVLGESGEVQTCKITILLYTQIHIIKSLPFPHGKVLS